MNICAQTKLKEIYTSSEFADVKDCLISGGSFFAENAELTLAELQQKNPTWDKDDIIFGLERLLKAEHSVFPLYSGVSGKENVKLLYLPSKKKSKDFYAVLLAGGAYGAVCTMIESLPVSARLNELGIDCFCLNYETATPASFEKGLLPAPLDDLATAIGFISGNKELFGLEPSNYIVGGFSAGGHVASLWGTDLLGAAKYNLPRAKGLMLAYPLITMETVQDGPVKSYMCTGMFGNKHSIDDIRRYDASRSATDNYPTTYIARALDDTTVSSKDAEILKTALDKLNVPCIIEQAPSGNHGFGLGTNTPICGWEKRAVEFFSHGEIRL